MDENIQYECLHCGKKNPEYLGYKGANCCSRCLKDLKYYVVCDDDNGLVIKLSIPLTKISARRFIDFDDKKKFYHNMRIVNFEEYDKLKLIRDIYYYKHDIMSTMQKLERLKAELKMKELILNENKKKKR